MRRHIKWLAKHYRQHPFVLTVLLVLTPIQAAVHILIPRLVGFTVDILKTGEVTDNFLAQSIVQYGGYFSLEAAPSFGVAFILLGFVSIIIYSIFQSTRAWMNVRLEWHFRQDAFDECTSKGPDFFRKFRTGDLVTRMTDDVAEKLSWFACSGIFRMYEATLGIVFAVAMLISIDLELTLWTAGPLPILVFVFMKSGALLDKRYDTLQKRISDFNDTMEAAFSGIRVVKAYVREKAQRRKFADAALIRRNAEIDAVKVTRIVDTLYNYVWQVSVVVVLLAGGYRVMQAELSIGELAAAIYYVIWLVFPMFDIGQFLVKSRQSAVSINRLREIEDAPAIVTEPEHPGTMPAEQVSLAFQNVSYTYDGTKTPALKGNYAVIKPRTTVALVGRVGSGKSTLINLVPRLFDPSSGQMTLDNKDMRQFALSELRSSIGYVPQEPILFSDTIRNNILIGRNKVTESTIDWALAVAQFKSEVDSFPLGLETEIGVRGMSISGGQKQRLALARALVGKPDILILDDCTSALDSGTETALWERMREVLPDLTSIVVTHRPDTLRLADRIIVLQGGELVENGTHDELVKQGGEYATIYHRYELEEGQDGTGRIARAATKN